MRLITCIILFFTQRRDQSPTQGNITRHGQPSYIINGMQNLSGKERKIKNEKLYGIILRIRRMEECKMKKKSWIPHFS